MFSACDYTGVDLQLGPGVDLACQGQLVEFPTGHFDTVISAECLEHNPYWRETVANMLRMAPRRPRSDQLRDDRAQRARHLAHQPRCLALHQRAKWDYYRNLRARDLAEAVNLPGWLSDHAAWVNHITKDLYFIGIRRAAACACAALRDALDNATR